MEDTRAARRYAQAFFEVASERKLVDRIEADLAVFCSLLDSQPEFRSFYNAPNISKESKAHLIKEVFQSSFSPLTLNMLDLMLLKRRAREVEAMREEFIKIRQFSAGIVSAQVTSSVALSEPQKKTLLSKLEGLIGKKIEAEYSLDPQILGGVKVAYDNRSIDGTIKGALEHLRQRFRHDVLIQA